MKRFFKLKKIHIVAIALIACVAMIVAAGGTLSYFTDTRELTNVFTAGNVYISLTEAAVKADSTGNLIEDTEAPRVQGVAIDSDEEAQHNYGMLYPGKVMHKDPTIQNTGDDPAWIAAKIIVTDGKGDINKLMGYYNSEAIDIEIILSGGLLDETVRVGTWNGIDGVCYNDRYAMVQIPSASTGTYEFYFFMNAEVLPGGVIELFDTMTVPSDFTSTDMREFAELKITVQAFAVQTYGFESCYNAMRLAFPEHFGSFN